MRTSLLLLLGFLCLIGMARADDDDAPASSEDSDDNNSPQSGPNEDFEEAGQITLPSQANDTQI